MNLLIRPNGEIVMEELIYKDESYRIIGLCMEVHRVLGYGFNEIVYKDALEYEFIENHLEYSREKKFLIRYKDVVLQRNYSADFVLFDKILLEVKSAKEFSNEHIRQTLNYLAISKLKLGIVVNFGKSSLDFKRIVL